MRSLQPLCLIALLLAPCAPAATAQAPRTGADLITRMHDGYRGRWHRGLFLVKRANFQDGRVQQWNETVRPPALRRIDIAPLDSLNGLLFRRDSLYEIQRGKPVTARAYVHALSALAYDVYTMPPQETKRRLAGLGFDLSGVRETVWQGRATYVVGANEGDRESSQFWVDKRGLYLVRLIERRAEGERPGQPPLVQEVWLDRYTKIGPAWLPSTLTYFKNGRQFLRETYESRRSGTPVDSTAFLAERWRAATWFR